MTAFLTTPQGRRIAYDRQPGQGPGVVFLGGFRSDMTGSKAQFLADWARAQGRAFLRFDYSGHGQSSGDFLDYCIGDGLQDALAALSALTEGPQVLVGSSMGGWISLLIARARPDLVRGLIGIAAAPDFTEDSIRPRLTPAQRTDLAERGHFRDPSAYDPTGYPITAKLLEDGARHLVLRSPLHLPMPVRLLHGTADQDVPPDVALRLFAHLTSPDARLTLVKDADHRFSIPSCLALIAATAAEVTAAGD
jgi:pimeloyl-ACP methyl ester carboxylesterase